MPKHAAPIAPHDNATGTERRGTPRIRAVRDAVFAAFQPNALLRHGTVENISLTGLEVRTPQPLPVGTQLDIELAPEQADGAKPVLVRGRVVRANPLPHGGYAMGVHLYVAPPKRAELANPPGAAEARRTLDRLTAQLRAEIDGVSSPLSYTEQTLAAARREVTFRPVGDARRRKWLLVLLLLLLLLLLAGGLTMLRGSAHPVRRGSASRPTPRKTAQPPLPRGFATAPPDRRIDMAQGCLASGQFELAGEMFELILAHPDLAPMERVLALLGMAQAAAGNGDVTLAMTHVRDALQAEVTLPVPWRAAIREFQAALGSPSGGPPPPLLLDTIAFVSDEMLTAPLSELRLV
ncbi:MAG: L,D-transpeptidase family protein, partial [Candidatus Hydrogenedentes bacterium]|nr:L,D-transpeptidase family protein [Candidatus Hydrogenedentota bacterium]